MILEFPARCVKCRAIMDAGTDAEFIRDNGSYEHYHSGGCPEAPKPRRKRFEFRVCPEPRCYAGHPGIAYPAGCCPPRCPSCNKPWLADDYLDVAA